MTMMRVRQVWTTNLAAFVFGSLVLVADAVS